MSNNDIVAAQHAIIGNKSQTPETNYRRTQHPGAQWFPQSLGLFIHWGISSVRGAGDLSWSMMLAPPGSRPKTIGRYGLPAVQSVLSPTDYWKEAENFKPDLFDPRKWLAAAKEAGFEYAVFTTKHHDGFTMWPSKISGLGVQTSLPGRDFVREYIAACREFGLKVGLYYSPPDWYLEKERIPFGQTVDHEGREVSVSVNHELIDAAKLPSVEEPAFKKIWNAQAKGHIYELLTSYGKIDILWFDGSSKDAVTLEELRELQPEIVFNNRGLLYGDYVTPECEFPAKRPSDWWEYNHIWNDGAWGYLSHETYKPIGWMIGEWIKARSWGGNFLINVGPNARGELPDPAYRRFAELAQWREKFGFSVDKNLKPGPWPDQCNACTLVDGSKWYVHLVFDWDQSEVIIKGVEAPRTVRLLSGAVPLELAWKMDAGELRIPIRKSIRGVISDIIEIDFAKNR